MDISDSGLKRLAMAYAGSSYSQTIEALRLIRDATQEQCADKLEARSNALASKPKAGLVSEALSICSLEATMCAALVRDIRWDQ